MPIFEYRARGAAQGKGCEYCQAGFEKLHRQSEPPLTHCPKCNEEVARLISSFGVAYGLDYRAKGTGLTKLVRRDKGTYEKQY